MKPQRLTIDSEVMEDFRRRLSVALEIVTCNLVKRNLKKGTVTAKVGITIEDHVNEDTGEIYYTMDIEPGVSMKVGTSDKMDIGKQKVIMQPDHQGRPMIASEQISMEELIEEGA